MLQFISSSNEVALIVWLNYLYISSLKNKVFFEKMNASVVREQKTSVSTALLDTHVNNPQELLRCSFHPDDSNYLPNIIYTAICKKEVHLPFSSLISDPSFESPVLPCHLLQNTSFKNVFFSTVFPLTMPKPKPLNWLRVIALSPWPTFSCHYLSLILLLYLPLTLKLGGWILVWLWTF